MVALLVRVEGVRDVKHADLLAIGVGSSFYPCVKLALKRRAVGVKFRTLSLGETVFLPADDTCEEDKLVLDVWSQHPNQRDAALIGKAIIPLNHSLPETLELELLSGHLSCQFQWATNLDFSVGKNVTMLDEAHTASLYPPHGDNVALKVVDSTPCETVVSSSQAISLQPPAMMPDEEEKASFRFCGVRARPRKKIAAAPRTEEVYLKPPGSCKGRWPEIEVNVEVDSCHSCSIYILDVTAQVQISDCRDCRIVVGPCSGSVFLLDCTNCVISAAARQVRLRNVSSSKVRTFVPQAEAFIVESCEALQIASWEVHYEGLDLQFELAGFSSTPNNNWKKVYDFTADKSTDKQVYEEEVGVQQSNLSIFPQGMCGGTVEESIFSPVNEATRSTSDEEDTSHEDFDAFEQEVSVTLSESRAVPMPAGRLESAESGGRSSSNWGLTDYELEDSFEVDDEEAEDESDVVEEIEEFDCSEDDDMGC